MLSHNNLVSQMAQMNHPKFAVIEEVRKETSLNP